MSRTRIVMWSRTRLYSSAIAQAAGPSSSSTSNDQISLEVPTGPPSRCCEWPAAKSGPESQAWKSSSDRQRVRTRQTSRSSLGRSSSKASKPSALDTLPARFAKRCANSSNRSRGTVIALILTTLTPGSYAGAGSERRAAEHLVGLVELEGQVEQRVDQRVQLVEPRPGLGRLVALRGALGQVGHDRLDQQPHLIGVDPHRRQALDVAVLVQPVGQRPGRAQFEHCVGLQRVGLEAAGDAPAERVRERAPALGL